jgi:hypothetical protein
VIDVGLWSSQKSALQRQTRPTSTIHDTHLKKGASATQGETRMQVRPSPPTNHKPFKEILRESYWKREQAHRTQEERDLALLRQVERDRLFGISTGKPEIYVDNVQSIGERDALNDYPALGLERGTVISDPKLNYRVSLGEK